jgi:hypothetical protein
MKIALIAIAIVAIAVLAVMWLAIAAGRWSNEMTDRIFDAERHDYKQTERDVEW